MVRSTKQRQEDALRSIDRSRQAIAEHTNTQPYNWLTTKEAMAFLGVSKPTLLRGRRLGLYRTVHHTATRFFYDRRTLEPYLTPSEDPR